MALPSVFDNFIRLRAASGMTEFTVMELPVAASQTILVNDLLSLSSGLVQQAIAAPSAGTSSLSGGNLPIVGVAMAPITTNASGQEVSAIGSTRTTTTVAIFDDRLNVLLRCATTNGASRTLSNYTQGTAYQFGRYTNAAGTLSWYFLSNTTTNGEMIFVEIPQDLKGSTSTYPTVWCKAVLSATIRQLG
jgi:hypothetical protein